MQIIPIKASILLLLSLFALPVVLAAPGEDSEVRKRFNEHVQKGRDAQAMEMIPKELDVNDKGRGDTSPLAQAIFSNREDVAAELVRRGANVNAVRFKGWTPLMDASSNYRSSMNLVNLLTAKGAKLDAQRFDGATSLQLAVEQRNNAVILALLVAGANPNIRNKDGQTPLFLVQTASAATLLVDYGGDVNLQDNRGRTAYDVVKEWELERLGPGELNDWASEYLRVQVAK